MIVIPLTQDQVTFINDEDKDLISQYKWFASADRDKNKKLKNWYVRTNIKQSDGSTTTLSMHRLLTNAKPEDKVDHEDHNGLNNQRYNLRLCNSSENLCNMRKRRIVNGVVTSSSYKGVYWYKRKEMWHVRIRKDNKAIHLGYFTSEIEAALAYNLAAIQHHGKWANLNIIKKTA